MVRRGLVTACRLAGSPTRRSPLSVKATTLGVNRCPSWLWITFASLPSMTATTELVVPRSMPIIFSTSATVVLLSVLLRREHEREWAPAYRVTAPQFQCFGPGNGGFAQLF